MLININADSCYDDDDDGDDDFTNGCNDDDDDVSSLAAVATYRLSYRKNVFHLIDQPHHLCHLCHIHSTRRNALSVGWFVF